MASNPPITDQGPLLTADGTPLKVSLQRSLRQNRNRAMLLVAPPLLFLVLLFIIPIGDMLMRSVDDKHSRHGTSRATPRKNCLPRCTPT